MKARGQPAAAPDFVISDDAEPTAPMRAGEANDRDLERLEASLRWLQREEAAMRLPRATSLPPVPGLAPVDTTGRHHRSEMLVDGLRAPRSLEPERLAPPIEMRSRCGNLRWPLAIVLTSILAVPIAYYFSVGSWDPPPELGPQIASLDQRFVAPQSKGTQKSVRPAPKTMILKRRSRWRCPPSVRAYLRQRDHPRARPWRCCRGASWRSGPVRGKSQPRP